MPGVQEGMQGAGNLCYRIHSLKYLRSIRHRVANI